MSVFEAGMMICFGASWPVALLKTYRAKRVEGKSVYFSYLVLLGYILGIIHKIVFNMDYVIWLYILNALFLVCDIILYHRYKR